MPDGGKNSILNKKVEIDEEYLQAVEINLAIIVLLIFPKNPFITEKAQLSKTIDATTVLP
jgi:hypothetical protein